MKRLIAVLFLSSVAFAQGLFVPPQVALRTVNGITFPLANASITVCPALAGGIPCAPVTVSVFSDVALTHPLSNPFLADASGNYVFAVAPGTYTVTVTGTGFNGYSYQISVAVAPVTGAGVATATGFSGRFMLIYADSGTGPVAEGTGTAPGSFLNGASGQSGTSVPPTATEPPGRSFTSDASASINLKAGTSQGWGAGLGADDKTFGNFLRLAFRVRLANSTNVRYWVGITDGASGDANGSGLATDTPNRSYCMFRFSAGVDTNIKAVCGTATATLTVVDTGIALDTANSMLFEIVPTASSVAFFINGVAAGTITTTLPAQGDRVGIAWTADNKNTANAVSGTTYSALVNMK